MAIDINNANYKLFTGFAATAAKQTTRAAIGTLLTEDGEARTVRASTRWDFIGNVGRLSATRADNNAVRDLFSKTARCSPMEGISENMYRVSSTGFGTLHNILGMILGETKDVPDQAEKGVPADYNLIIADYAKDMKALLGMAV